MALTAAEREQALKLAAIAGFVECPECGEEILAHDDGVSPAQDGMPAGAFVVCDSCGWEYVHNG